MKICHYYGGYLILLTPQQLLWSDHRAINTCVLTEGRKKKNPAFVATHSAPLPLPHHTQNSVT